MTIKWKGKDELYFWLALSPLQNSGDKTYGIFIEFARYRVDITWGKNETI